MPLPELQVAIYGRLVEWGYEHQTVCHSHGEYARDEDGDGLHEFMWVFSSLSTMSGGAEKHYFDHFNRQSLLSRY